MSASATNMKKLGNTNASWGVCGFTSSFYALWKMEKAARPKLINAPLGFTVLAEIKTYLRILQAEEDSLTILEIERFCQSFGPPFDKFTINNYCNHISESVTSDEATILKDPQFSIGIPPNAVADYLRRMWNFNSTVVEVPLGSDPGGDAIIGMVVGDGTLDPNKRQIQTLYNRLVHYMYRRKGKIYSWGLGPYDSIAAAELEGASWAKGWRIGWVITIEPKVGASAKA